MGQIEIAKAQTTPGQNLVAANESSYQAWDSPEQPVGPNHRTTFRKRGSSSSKIVELATGMNYWNGSQWVASEPSFVEVQDGFYAGKIQDTVHLGNDLYSSGSVTINTPDGNLLKSTPLAIALFDAATGNFQVIATVTNCAPVLVNSNEVMYVDAFSGGVCANVAYTITAGTFHQDVIFTGPVNPADYGFPRDTTRIQIVTEFYNAPTPDELRRPLYVEQREKVRAKMISPDLIDEQLGFGRFVLTTGTAFVQPSAANTNKLKACVAKEYKTIAGRTYLFESVPYLSLENALTNLPPCHPSLQSSRSIPVKGYAGIPRPGSQAKGKPLLAKIDRVPMPGVVIDYVANIGGTMSGTTVFQGDTTYLVSSTVSCNGPTTIEGGAVFKYKSGTSINLNSSLTCKTGMYRPAVFTAVDDDTLGDTMNGVANSGYTGSISPFRYANPALFTQVSLNFIGLRFRYAKTAIKVFGDNTTWTVSHSQFVNCIKGIDIEMGSGGSGSGSGSGGSSLNYFNVENCLFSYVSSPIVGTDDGGLTLRYVSLYNTTFDHAGYVASLSGGSPGVDNYISLTVENSIFANISSGPTSGISFGGANNAFYNNGYGVNFGSAQFSLSSSPFQTVGGGNYYLTSNSGLQNQGNTSLPSPLLSDLKKRTTSPPLVTAGTNLITAQLLVPSVQRNTNSSPDLGYHYDPVDYAFGGVYVSNTTMTVGPGTAIATFGTNGYSFGLGFGGGSSLSSTGEPANQNWFVLYNTVMEGASGGWSAPSNSVTGEQDGATPAPSINARFTAWSVLAQDACHFYAPGYNGQINFQDNEFHNGKLVTEGPTINLTNCLLERVFTQLKTTDGVSPHILNCLFWAGEFDFLPDVSTAMVKDNFFDKTAITNNSSSYTTYDGGYNGFVTSSDRLQPTFTSDKVLSSSPSYRGGPLGNYYQLTTSGLINFGHTNADRVALYHYTVTTNLLNGAEIKETNSIVDIGYHYVAVDSNGAPIDLDYDGIPDYLEDSNGNGKYDAGDLGNWLINAYNGLSPSYILDVYTPLK